MSTLRRWAAVLYRVMQVLAALAWIYAVVRGLWAFSPGWLAVFMIAGHLSDHAGAKP